jgi:hypothetical protein
LSAVALSVFFRGRYSRPPHDREGHDFSRAVRVPHLKRLLAAEGLRQELE